MKIEILGNSDTRSGFGDGLSYLGEINPNVLALCADLTGSLKMNNFQCLRNNILHYFSSKSFNKIINTY